MFEDASFLLERSCGTGCKLKTRSAPCMASLTILDAAERVRSGAVTSEELVVQALKRIEETEGQLGAFLSVQGRAAIETARDVDRKVGQTPVEVESQSRVYNVVVR